MQGRQRTGSSCRTGCSISSSWQALKSSAKLCPVVAAKPGWGCGWERHKAQATWLVFMEMGEGWKLGTELSRTWPECEGEREVTSHGVGGSWTA